MTFFKKLSAALVLAAACSTSAFAARQEPELVEVAAPEYPRGAERRELEGYVVVRYTVSPEGRVDSPEIVEAEPAGVFDRAVLRALEDWRYAPPAAPVAGVEKRFDFNLQD